MSGPRITAVVCTHRREDVLGLAVSSLAQQNLATDEYEILVIDNAPGPDPSVRFAAIPNLRWVDEPMQGLAHARNRGAAEAHAPILAFLDDDALAAPDWLARILEGFERYGARAAALGGRIDPIWLAPRPVWLHDDLLGYLSVVNWGGDLRIAGQQEWLAGANVAFRRDALVGIGGFDPQLGRQQDRMVLLSNEESEVLRRLRARQHEVLYAPEAIVRHLVARERLTQPWFRRRAAWQATSDFIVDPDKRTREARQAWPAVRGFVNALPPRHRSLRGLAAPIDDPDLFKRQLGAVYSYTILLLAGLPDVDE